MLQRVAGHVVLGEADAVDRRVAHVDVGRAHVDLGAQDHAAFGVLAGAHLAEQAQVLLAGRGTGNRCRAGSTSPRVGAHLRRRSARRRRRSPARSGTRQSGTCTRSSRSRGRGWLGAVRVPVEAEPVHGVEDAVDELLVFLLRVGVVEAHVAHAAEVARQAEVQADALGVADVQVAVGLGREAGADPRRVGRALAWWVASPGVPAKWRPAYVPCARSRSMIWRRKLLVRVSGAEEGMDGAVQAWRRVRQPPHSRRAAAHPCRQRRFTRR